MSQFVPQTSFSSGELSPRALGRVDQDYFRHGCRKLDNAFISDTGTAVGRWGSRHVGSNPSDSRALFVEWSPRDKVVRVVELTDQLLRIWKEGSLEAETFSTPFLEANLDDIRAAAVGDHVYFVDGKNFPQELMLDDQGDYFFGEQDTKNTGPQADPRRKKVSLRVYDDKQQDVGLASQVFNLVASEDIFTEEDTNGLGTIWRVGESWFRAKIYISRKRIRGTALSLSDDRKIAGPDYVGDTTLSVTNTVRGIEDEDTIDSVTDWSGPWVPQAPVVGQAFTSVTASGVRFINEEMSLENGPSTTGINTHGYLVEFNRDSSDSAYTLDLATPQPSKSGDDYATHGYNKLDPYKIDDGTGVLGFVFDDDGTSKRTILISGSADSADSWSGSRFWILDDRETPKDGASVSIHYDLTPNTGRLGVSTPAFVEGKHDATGVKFYVAGGVFQVDDVDPTGTIMDFTVLERPRYQSTVTHEWSFGFNEHDGFPEDAIVHQDRLCYGHGGAVSFSRTAKYSEFLPNSRADSPFALRLKGTDSRVLWMHSTGVDLLVGTEEEEYAIQGAPLSAVQFGVNRNSDYGSSRVQPVAFGTMLLFVDRSDRVRALRFVRDEQRYVAPDITALARHLFGGGITRLADARSPESLVFSLTGDGQIKCLTLREGGGIQGWSGWVADFTIHSITSVRSGGVDELWASVETTAGHHTWIFSSLSVLDGEVSSNTALAHLEGKSVEVSLNGDHVGSETVSGGQVSLVGDRLGLQPAFKLIPVNASAEGEKGVIFGQRVSFTGLLVLLNDTFGGSVVDGGADGAFGLDPYPLVAENYGLLRSAVGTTDGWVKVDIAASGRDPIFEIVQAEPYPIEVVGISTSVDVGVE